MDLQEMVKTEELLDKQIKELQREKHCLKYAIIAEVMDNTLLHEFVKWI